MNKSKLLRALHYMGRSNSSVHWRQIRLVEAFPPEEIPELAKDRPLLLAVHGVLHAHVVALVDVVELVVVVVVHGRVRRRGLEVGHVAERREHPVLGVQAPHPRRLRVAHAFELGRLADRVAPPARRPGLLRHPAPRPRLRRPLGAGDEPPVGQVPLVKAALRRHGRGRGRGHGSAARRRRRGGEQAVELLEAALRGGLADLDALVLLPEALQRALLLGDDVVEPRVLDPGELQRLLDDVGLADGLLEDVAEAGVLVADHALRLHQLGVLLPGQVHLLLGGAHALEEDALLVAPRGRRLLGLEPAPVLLPQPRLGGGELPAQPRGLGIGGLQLRLRVGEPALDLLGLHGDVGEREGQVVQRLPAPLLPLHGRPEVGAQGPDLLVGAAEHEVLDAPLVHDAAPGLEAPVALLQRGHLQLGLLQADLGLLQLLGLVYERLEHLALRLLGPLHLPLQKLHLLGAAPPVVLPHKLVELPHRPRLVLPLRPQLLLELHHPIILTPLLLELFLQLRHPLLRRRRRRHRASAAGDAATFLPAGQ
uniref:Uncharacterized protein n=1 Tax=Aegilops tauschii subsp. strangulata TaxID=200361 RepID=A0A453C3E8_AEGTS